MSMKDMAIGSRKALVNVRVPIAPFKGEKQASK